MHQARYETPADHDFADSKRIVSLSLLPLIFEGNSLEINYATSASGEVRIEVQSGEGRPIEGFTLSKCDAIFGDQISRTVTWGGNADVSRISGKPIKLRFVLKDADLYSFRFGQ
jgi:hypothetical protein